MWDPDPKLWFESDVLPSRLPTAGADPAPDPKCMNWIFHGILLCKVKLELQGRWSRSGEINTCGRCAKARLMSPRYLGVYRYLLVARELSVLTISGLETHEQLGPGERDGDDDVVC